MRVRAMAWSGLAAGLLVSTLSLAVPAAHADDPPFTISTLSAESGYFEVSGTCPKSTSKLRFSWSPSPSGPGWGEISIKAKKPFTLPIRMLSSAPGETISVRLECRSSGGRTRLAYGPIDLASGDALLADPPSDPGAGTGRHIVYSLSAQQLWAYEADGSLARSYLVSGRRLSLTSASTQLGSFKVFSKSKMGCVGGIRCPFMVRFNKTRLNNLGFHAIPWSKYKGFWQTPAELGQPRSGGCVRANPDDAEWLFNWSVKGDPVHVVP